MLRNERSKIAGAGMEKETNFSALSELAQSTDAQKLMAMLQQRGEVRGAAEAAAAGNPAQLMAMMNEMIRTKDGAELVARIEQKAKQAGLY